MLIQTGYSCPMKGISVVIPYFNAERTISRTLDSVYSQSCPPTEVIVVDDGSCDGAADYVGTLQKSYGFRLVRQQNTGVSGARNAGVASANHDLLSFLDADDLWKPDYLESLLPRFDKEETGLVFSRLEWIDQDDHLLGVSNKIVSEPTLERLLLGNFVGSGSNFIIRRSCFEAIGGFSTDLVGTEDYLFVMEFFLQRKWRAVQVPDVLVQYRRITDSLSQNHAIMLKGLLFVYREVQGRLALPQRVMFLAGLLKMRLALHTVGLRSKLGR